MRELAQPVPGVLPVELNYRIDAALFGWRELAWIALRPGVDLELAPVHVVERADDGAIRPGLNLLVEQRLFLPYQMPRLGVVDELLKLPRRYRTLFLEDVGSDIVGGGHSFEVSRSGVGGSDAFPGRV